jgi:ubiquinone/menaquinone biosynthesis C-methylase UbiE
MGSAGLGFDYDRRDVHRTYAAGRALTPEQVAFWRGLLSQELGAVPVRRVLDLGCGVGRFSGLLREVFGARVYGLDRSERTLAVAAANPALRGISWVRAMAEALPLADTGVDLVFLFLVYHHLADRLAALRECARVLAAAGHVVIIASTVELLDSYPWLPFFPSARAIDLARLPHRAAVSQTAREAGLTPIRLSTVMNPVAPSLGAYADRIASRTLSTLQLVPDEEFAKGIVELRRHFARENRGQPVAEPTDVFLFRRASARRPPIQ